MLATIPPSRTLTVWRSVECPALSCRVNLILIGFFRHIFRIPHSSRFHSVSRENDRRTDSGGLDHVADGESLDGLVLGSASRAVGASDGLDVTTALLVTSAIERELALVHFDQVRCVRIPKHAIYCRLEIRN